MVVSQKQQLCWPTVPTALVLFTYLDGLEIGALCCSKRPWT